MVQDPTGGPLAPDAITMRASADEMVISSQCRGGGCLRSRGTHPELSSQSATIVMIVHMGFSNQMDTTDARYWAVLPAVSLNSAYVISPSRERKAGAWGVVLSFDM